MQIINISILMFLLPFFFVIFMILHEGLHILYIDLILHKDYKVRLDRRYFGFPIGAEVTSSYWTKQFFDMDSKMQRDFFIVAMMPYLFLVPACWFMTNSTNYYVMIFGYIFLIGQFLNLPLEFVYQSHGLIVLISGGLGSGKTCLLTKYAILSHIQGKMNISNYHLRRIPYKKLDMVDLYINHPDLKNMFIGGDELYTFMDCRTSISKRNRLESYFVAQTRKANVDLYFTSQFSSFVDLRLIKFVDLVIQMENIWLINKKTGIKYKHPYLFIMTITDYRDPHNISSRTCRFDGRQWFKEYDTNERIYPPEDFIQVNKEMSKKRS